MPIAVDISWGTGGGGVYSNTRINNYSSVDSDDNFRWGIETSVTIIDYLLSQLLRSTLSWKIKLSSPKVLLFWNYSLFNQKIIIKSGSYEIF